MKFPHINSTFYEIDDQIKMLQDIQARPEYSGCKTNVDELIAFLISMQEVIRQKSDDKNRGILTASQKSEVYYLNKVCKVKIKTLAEQYYCSVNTINRAIKEEKLKLSGN